MKPFQGNSARPLKKREIRALSSSRTRVSCRRFALLCVFALKSATKQKSKREGAKGARGNSTPPSLQNYQTSGPIYKVQRCNKKEYGEPKSKKGFCSAGAWRQNCEEKCLCQLCNFLFSFQYATWVSDVARVIFLCTVRKEGKFDRRSYA